MTATASPTSTKSIGNPLFPIFIKLEQFRVLIVGGGNVGLEKATALLRNSPATEITVVGKEIREELRDFCAPYENVRLIVKAYQTKDLDSCDLVLIATDDPTLNRLIHREARAKGIWANVADTPDACDFYLGSIVQKGNLKIAISTNGKSPTIAKRLKETLNEALPDEMDSILNSMHTLRQYLKGDFNDKIRQLDQITQGLAAAPQQLRYKRERNWQRLATLSLSAFGLLLLTNVLTISGAYKAAPPEFWGFLLVGFAAQMIDGLLGMGYGLSAAIGLMTMNVSAAALSSSIHTAEMFASGASGYSHYRFGNVDRALLKRLLLPGIVGAVTGALLLSWLDGRSAEWVRPFLAVYIFGLGCRLLWRAFRPAEAASMEPVKRIALLAGLGGFLDSFGGGGWGPLVTGTLISKGKTPRTVIGSVSVVEFFVTFSSAFTFFAAIGIQHWPVVLGLTVGGVAAAPLAARLAGRLPVKKMTIGVGLIALVWSMVILGKLAWG
jgi:uncharacterized protein